MEMVSYEGKHKSGYCVQDELDRSTPEYEKEGVIISYIWETKDLERRENLGDSS